jgi:hypothetical protein
VGEGQFVFGRVSIRFAVGVTLARSIEFVAAVTISGVGETVDSGGAIVTVRSNETGPSWTRPGTVTTERLSGDE